MLLLPPWHIRHNIVTADAMRESKELTMRQTVSGDPPSSSRPGAVTSCGVCICNDCCCSRQTTDRGNSYHVPCPVASPYPTPARRSETRVCPQRLGGHHRGRQKDAKERKTCFEHFTLAFGVLLLSLLGKIHCDISLVMGFCRTAEPLVF